MNDDDKLTVLIKISKATGISLDLIYDLSLGLDAANFKLFCSNAELLAQNRKPNDFNDFIYAFHATSITHLM